MFTKKAICHSSKDHSSYQLSYTVTSNHHRVEGCSGTQSRRVGVYRAFNVRLYTRFVDTCCQTTLTLNIPKSRPKVHAKKRHMATSTRRLFSFLTWGRSSTFSSSSVVCTLIIRQGTARARGVSQIKRHNLCCPLPHVVMTGYYILGLPFTYFVDENSSPFSAPRACV